MPVIEIITDLRGNKTESGDLVNKVLVNRETCQIIGSFLYVGENGWNDLVDVSSLVLSKEWLTDLIKSLAQDAYSELNHSMHESY